MKSSTREFIGRLGVHRSRAWTIVWLASGFLLSVILLVVSESSHYRFARENEALLRAVRLTTVLSNIVGRTSMLESMERGYLLSHDNAYLETYRRSLDELDRMLDELHEPGSGGLPEADQILLTRTVREKLDVITAMIHAYESEGLDSAIRLARSDIGKSKMLELKNLVGRLTKDRHAWITDRTARWVQDLMISRVSIASLALFTIVSLLVFARRGLREIRRERELSQELADHRDRLEQTVRERTQELSSLSISLQHVQEQERGRLARELHDELGAILTSSKMGLSLALSKLPDMSPDIFAKVRSVMSALDSGIDLKRRIIENLRPSALDHLGLTATLQMYLDETCARAGVRCRHAIDEAAPLAPTVAIAIFRIVQESLTNIFKYAKATEIDVSLARSAHSISLRIADDGEGFDLSGVSPVEKHGLVGMRQRMVALGGRLVIESTLGRGTVVSCLVPLDAQPG